MNYELKDQLGIALSPSLGWGCRGKSQVSATCQERLVYGSGPYYVITSTLPGLRATCTTQPASNSIQMFPSHFYETCPAYPDVSIKGQIKEENLLESRFSEMSGVGVTRWFS